MSQDTVADYQQLLSLVTGSTELEPILTSEQLITIAKRQGTVEQLITATTELQSTLEAVKQRRMRIEQIHFSVVTDAATGVNAAMQSAKVASQAIQAGNEEAIRIDIITAISSLIHQVSALTRWLEASNSRTDMTAAAQSYNTQVAICAAMNEKATALLNQRVTPLESSKQTTSSQDTWIPLATIRTKTEEEIVRVLVRAIRPDQQIDDDLSSLLFQLTQSAHLLLTQKQVSGTPLWQDGQQLYEAVSSQEFRDAVSGSVAPYFRKLLETSGNIACYEPVFFQAVQSVKQWLIRYYAIQSSTPQHVHTPMPTQTASQSTILTTRPRGETPPASTTAASTVSPAPNALNTTVATPETESQTIDLRTVATTPTTKPTEPVTQEKPTPQPSRPAVPKPDDPATESSSGQDQPKQPPVKPIHLR